MKNLVTDETTPILNLISFRQEKESSEKYDRNFSNLTLNLENPFNSKTSNFQRETLSYVPDSLQSLRKEYKHFNGKIGKYKDSKDNYMPPLLPMLKLREDFPLHYIKRKPKK